MRTSPSLARSSCLSPQMHRQQCVRTTDHRPSARAQVRRTGAASCWRTPWFALLIASCVGLKFVARVRMHAHLSVVSGSRRFGAELALVVVQQALEAHRLSATRARGAPRAAPRAQTRRICVVGCRSRSRPSRAAFCSIEAGSPPTRREAYARIGSSMGFGMCERSHINAWLSSPAVQMWHDECGAHARALTHCEAAARLGGGQRGHADVEDDDLVRVHRDRREVVGVLLVPRQPDQRDGRAALASALS